MIGARQATLRALELLDTAPAIHVLDAEYRRLLGYPSEYEPGERAIELSAWARQWYAANGRPWVYLREADLKVEGEGLEIDGIEFRSAQLHDHLRLAGAQRAVMVAVSAGRQCEEYARQLWEESKPDEYFFLEIFGSAVVEHLVATLSGRICDMAEREGLMAVPHYSPGYTGWNIADQPRLFQLITQGMSHVLPESLEVMSSGMLKPKKSLLAVVGLAPNVGRARPAGRHVPCVDCSFAPCQYRRGPYRHVARSPEDSSALSNDGMAPSASPLDRAARYTVNGRALRKWAQERVQLERRDDGSVAAAFRFDGTTCSSQGRPLAFDYSVTLSSSRDDFTILQAECRPSADDTGHQHMCAFIEDSEALMQAIGSEKPLLGRPLHEVFAWTRVAAPSGCHCTAFSRAHKWGLALEVIHYALAHAGSGAGNPPRSANPLPDQPSSSLSSP